MKKTGDWTKVIFGSREHRKLKLWFWGRRENAEIFQGNKGTGTPLGGPHFCLFNHLQKPVSVAQLDAPSDWRPGGRGFNPQRGRQHSFVEIDHEIFSTVILSLPLIQEGQLSVSGERMCTILVNRLEDYACPVNVWLGKLTVLDMTPLGWLGRKTSTQTKTFFRSLSN